MKEISIKDLRKALGEKVIDEIHAELLEADREDVAAIVKIPGMVLSFYIVDNKLQCDCSPFFCMSPSEYTGSESDDSFIVESFQSYAKHIGHEIQLYDWGIMQYQNQVVIFQFAELDDEEETYMFTPLEREDIREYDIKFPSPYGDPIKMTYKRGFN